MNPRRRALAALLAAAAIPAARAQPRPDVRRVVLVIGPGLHDMSAEEVAGFQKRNLARFADEGFTPGAGFALEVVKAPRRNGPDLDAFARGVIARSPALVMIPGDLVREFRRVATQVPVVFHSLGIDPVAFGIVESFARPGGNMTGTSTVSPGDEQKGFDLLRELVPQAQRIGLVWYEDERADPMFAELRRPYEQTAARWRIGLVDIFIPRDVDAAAFERAIRKARVDFVDMSGMEGDEKSLAPIMKSLERLRMPALWFDAGKVAAGGLLSTTPSLSEAYREAVKMAALILRGADPATLPVRTPRRIVTAINLRTARAMGLAVPQSVLLRADTVIE